MQRLIQHLTRRETAHLNNTEASGFDMIHRQILPSHSPTKVFLLSLQPAQAWMAILGLVLFTALCIVVGEGKILNLAFPAGAFAVGVLLYLRYPTIYVGFTWWICFLTPLVRRLADYRSGFTDPSPILLAPYLVILVTLATLWQHLPKTHRHGGLPFVLTFVGVFYGFLIGLIQGSPIKVTIALLDWLTPVLFGFYLFVNWRNYGSYRQNIQRTFVWAVLLTGVYGIYQYLVAPPWDRFWMINVNRNSFGLPEPLGIRVWSTMNAPLVFAVVMMAGLLLLFSYKGPLRLPASGAGYLAFLLSLARTAWGGWFVGLLTLASSLKSSLQMRLIITMMVIAVCVVPLTTIEPFSEVIHSRLETLSNVEDDGSAQARMQIYEYWLDDALNNFQGMGIGNAPGVDSAILNLLLSLGWLGTIFYMGGMLLLLFELFQCSESRLDPFASTARAIALGIFFQLILGSVMIEIPGVVLWGFLGMGMAARKYYQYQPTHGFKEG